ncbi:MAG: DUF2585 family protein [Planctomycetota bacterium]|nr:DUF2585 family protein [Planctomycetota bacterium]
MELDVPPQPRLSFRVFAWLCIATMLLAALAELAMGRRLFSASGRILLWVSDVNGPENSQQTFDWYSFSHVIHGMALYWFARILGRAKWPVGAALLFTVVAESAWEVLENSSWVIDRYRQTLAAGYVGDSVYNSMCDVLCCVAGFALARKLPVAATIALIILMEVGVAFVIRDNLTLNVIMLLHPFEGIKQWQQGAGPG